jgi:hypothetical protein
VKNFVPSKKRFGRLKYRDERRAMGSVCDVDVAARPPHEVTRATAALGVFQRSFQHEGLFQRRVLVQRHDRAGRHLEQDGRAPSPSRYRIFISMPSKSVRCQGIDDAATKVERSSGGLTGTGLFMASSPDGWLISIKRA